MSVHPASSSSPPPRRNRRRWPWIFLGGVLAGGALALGLLLTPPVQGWLLRRFIASQPGWQVEFERFDAGPTGVEVRGLDFRMPGVAATSQPIRIRIAPGRLLNKRELQIERVEAQKLAVTLTPAELPSSPEPFSGLMALLRSPLAWALDEASFDGVIAVRDGGQSIAIGEFTINGGGVSANQPGEFSYELAVNSALLPLGPENKVRSRGKVRLTQGPNHGVSRIAFEGDLALPRYGALTLPRGTFKLEIAATPSGETYVGSLDFGPGGRFELRGELDAARARLTGGVTLHADQSLAASLLGEQVPVIGLSGGADFTFDTATGNLDAKLSGDLDARDWAKLLPQLAVVDALKGRLTAEFSRRARRNTLTRFQATLSGEKTPATLQLDLTQPVDLLALPTSPFARVSLDRWPVQWLNPWLVGSQIAVDPAEFGGGWDVALTRDFALDVIPNRPVTVTPFAAKGAALPPLPSLAIRFSPRLSASRERVSVTIDDFNATSAHGDRLELKLSAAHAFADGATHAKGELRGAVPTLLSGSARPLPFSLESRWDVTHRGHEIRIDALELAARRETGDPPCVAMQLLQPLTLDLERLAVPRAGAAGEWLRLRVAALPLDWLSHWKPGYTIAGQVAAGESVLRSDSGGKLAFATTVPWQLSGFALGVGGRDVFGGQARVTPSVAIESDRITAEFTGIDAEDRDGNRVTGSIAVEASLGERKGATTLALEASLPRLPHSEGTFGALQATLRARSHNESASIAVVDSFELRVRHAGGELFALEAPQPFLFGLSRAGMFSAGTVAPLKLTTGEIPLAWTRPWSGRLQLEGRLQPAELALTAELTKFLLRPVKPVNVRGFAARIDGRDIASDSEFTFYPGLDLTLICMPLPTFTLAYTGTAHLTNGSVDIGGRRAVDVDLAAGFMGDDERVLPSSLEYSTRADFAELSRVPVLAQTGLPARGTLVARASGDLLGQAPLELWTRIEGVASADGKRTLPPLELTAHGKVSLDQTIATDVAVRVETTPRPTDARFDLTVNLRDSTLQFASAFRSEFFDAAEALAWAEAFQPRATGDEPAPAAATTDAAVAAGKPRSDQQLGTPFWSMLRGHFDLDLGAVQFAPYRVDHVRGRLELHDRELVLDQLSGEMFAGRWGGEVRVAYQPENSAADHALDGAFTITQFDSARVVQTVFPTELASVDARIDVRSNVRSRGNSVFELVDRVEGDFTVEGKQGVVRLTVPKQEMAATAAVFGGTVLLSPELRALGRLLKKFAEMPVDEIRISGERAASGDVSLKELRIDSPQARLLAQGRIPAVEGQPLMNRPLELSIDLAAKDEMAVILGGMSLIEKKPRADGYRPLKEKFVLGGKAGEPDTRPLYDLLAKAVVGSKGTWGFLMRKVQEQVNRMKPAQTAAPRAGTP